ncbi:MAG: exodeoxyribonuclease VII large subunit [Bdellovibrionales bacterium]|nr:exodeoxyribonuclease VII large subunit [Bdellovibrionales bacterium]
MSFNLNTKAKTGGTQSSDIFNSESEGPHILQVSQLNQMIRQFLENEFQLIWIQGEISNFKAHPFSQVTFTLALRIIWLRFQLSCSKASIVTSDSYQEMAWRF